ncbi:DUF4407 domain-containing protein [Mycolicibacterium stellerae]|uniref:DUF4407 domain-containing protein n=1 Tax=Mycolicibacterium stellerae TaxID=2358193 RepID=UPI000F0BBB08|nr:DUF4407 domain-containing protein [Mycolicibacterium stellerae]
MSAKPFSAVVSWPRALAYAIAAVVMGVVVGELAAMLIFAGSSDRRLDEQAARNADATPAVVAASSDLERTRQARTALDSAVLDASRQRDEALVVARCEVNPSPACPQTHITGVPGAGPEHRTADEFLADTQGQLDKAVVERHRLAPSLDAAVADASQQLAQARDAAVASADRGFGARWLAMNAHTLASPAATVLRALLSGLFVLLFLFPLLLRLSRAKTTEDRRTAARTVRERADLEADTAIAVKKAEVRAAIETMRAEQELASARLEIEAQNEIDREEQRRRVAAAIEAPTQVSSQRVTEVVAELEADPSAGESSAESDHLPALTEPAAAEKRSLIPALPDVAGAAVRWVRPFVPPIVASAIDTTTRPLRGARQVFEETEEIHFSLRRSHRVSVTAEETAEPAEQWIDATPTAQVPASGGRRRLPPAES